jgi:D-sedoheptulose 7-phosphate isomerase
MLLKRYYELGKILEQCSCTLAMKSVSIDDALGMTHFLLSQTHLKSGLIYVIGNGGSAGIASHFSTDLLRTLDIASATLSDSTIITCFSNDFGFESVYSLPLARILRHNDMLVAISSSGQSQNILNAVKTAQDKKIPIITLSGFHETNALKKMGDLNFWLDSQEYGLVESGHFFILHTIIDTFKVHAQCSEALKGRYAGKN